MVLLCWQHVTRQPRLAQNWGPGIRNMHHHSSQISFFFPHTRLLQASLTFPPLLPIQVMSKYLLILKFAICFPSTEALVTGIHPDKIKVWEDSVLC